jgi:DNA-binding MarR family transcriptional regulator
VVSAAGRGSARLSQADYERLARFRYLLRRFLAFSEDAADEVGLTPQQHQALLAIKGFGARSPMDTGALAECLGIRHHSAVGLLDRLVAKRLVRRRVGREDRRQVLAELTPKAENVLRDLSLAHRRELERLSPVLRLLLEQMEARPVAPVPKVPAARPRGR